MEKFIEFLERNNAWEKFEKNFRAQKRNVDSYKKGCKIWKNFYLAGAFNWADTPEGYKYWQKLKNEWTKENLSLKEILLSDD